MNILRKVVINIYNLLTGTKNAFVYRALFFILFVSPVVVLAIINYSDLDRESTTSILAKRRSLSVLSAAIIHEKLDNLVNLGISYATRPRVIEYVEKGDWKGAISITTHALDSFPSFDRIIFYDPYGVIKADMPHAIPSVIGQSRADREWYNIVKRSWKPHISGVYIKGAEPKMPVVSVIVPIKTLTSSTTAGHSTVRGEQEVIGILQFQIKLDIFNDWIDNVDIGPGSIIYIVDQYGRLVYHPRYIKEKTLTDFSSVGIVTKVLRGIGGSEVNYNPIEKEERLAAYEPVLSYGWGVVITQPTGLAFIEKNERLHNAIIIYSIIVSLAGAMALLILYSIVTRKRAEDALRESEELYRTLAEKSMAGVYVVQDGKFRFINSNAASYGGYTKEELLNQKADLIVNPEDREKVRQNAKAMLLGETSSPYEYSIITKQGETRWIMETVTSILYEGRRAILGNSMDITTRKHMEEEIRTISLTDPLTGLYNRRGFLNLAEQQLKIAKRTKTGLLLLFADLDGMKWINDNLGHKKGDEALIEAANVLKQVFRDADIVARVGGDEFSVLAVGIEMEDSRIIEDRLQYQIGINNSRENRDYSLSMSVGMAYNDPENPSTIDELMSHADVLMYEQKKGGQS